ncbi:hypothetical protein MBLNU230_g4873t1 [Neophaeotheca triangularis]
MAANRYFTAQYVPDTRSIQIGHCKCGCDDAAFAILKGIGGDFDVSQCRNGNSKFTSVKLAKDISHLNPDYPKRPTSKKLLKSNISTWISYRELSSALVQSNDVDYLRMIRPADDSMALVPYREATTTDDEDDGNGGFDTVTVVPRPPPGHVEATRVTALLHVAKEFALTNWKALAKDTAILLTAWHLRDGQHFVTVLNAILPKYYVSLPDWLPTATALTIATMQETLTTPASTSMYDIVAGSRGGSLSLPVPPPRRSLRIREPSPGAEERRRAVAAATQLRIEKNC